MMGIVVTETCWAYKKYNKIISGIQLGFLFFSLKFKFVNGREENERFWILFIQKKLPTKLSHIVLSHVTLSTEHLATQRPVCLASKNVY